MILIPKNWHSFQHYNKRNPPWIKLHRALLDDHEFSMLPLESRALTPMLWLIASESKEGHIKADSDTLAFRLRESVEFVEKWVKPLVVAGFFFYASDPLAGRKQSATPETEGEAETETENLTRTEKSIGEPVPMGWEVDFGS
jgi:hypothetical protein